MKAVRVVRQTISLVVTRHIAIRPASLRTQPSTYILVVAFPAHVLTGRSPGQFVQRDIIAVAADARGRDGRDRQGFDGEIHRRPPDVGVLPPGAALIRTAQLIRPVVDLPSLVRQ